MKYAVLTRATVLRTRYVEASNQSEAEKCSIHAPIEHEEDENEETLSVTEIPNRKKSR